jgi:hypothetical protein
MPHWLASMCRRFRLRQFYGRAHSAPLILRFALTAGTGEAVAMAIGQRR